MRMLSVARSKKNYMGGNSRDMPTPGSHVGRLGEFFLRNRGRMVAYSMHPRKDGAAIEQLRSIYGLDICRANPPWRKYWILRGEWFGHRYVDYTTNPSTEAVPRDWREWQLNPPASSEAA